MACERAFGLTSLRLLWLSLILLLGGWSSEVLSQNPNPSPSPSPAPRDEQEAVRVFTEEIRLPVIAIDQFGNYDPTVELDDIMVLEDGVSQQVKSIRRIPANVVLVLDTGGELSGLGGQSKRTSLTKQVASQLLQKIKPGTWVQVMQFNNSVDLLQDWTTDRSLAAAILKTKLSSGKRARFGDAIAAAAKELSDRPEGSRHIVFITDGVDTGSKIDKSEAIKRLLASRATVHIISYTEFVRQKKEGRKSDVRAGQMPTTSDPITSTDPTQPPGTTRSPTFGVSIRLDPAMRRQRKAYEADVKKSQQALTNIAEETGGQILLPKSEEQMVAQAAEVAREIGAEYVLTYKPKRPLAEARTGEYRRVEVTSRRVGLTVRSRRGYVVPSTNN
jgi:VWFA-related protein